MAHENIPPSAYCPDMPMRVTSPYEQWCMAAWNVMRRLAREFHGAACRLLFEPSPFALALVPTLIALVVWLAHGMLRGDPEAATSAAIAVVILLTALISSVVGFAFSALAIAPLAHLSISAVEIVGVMLASSIAIQGYSVWALRRSIRWRRIALFVVCGAATIPVGVWVLLHTPHRAYVAALGVFLAVYGLAMMSRPLQSAPRRRNRLVDGIVGALGGVTGGIGAFPGAFITPWCGMQGWNKDRQRATYQPYILIMQLITLVALLYAAPTIHFGTAFLIYAPVAVAGAHGGIAVFRRMTTRQFTLCANAFLVIAGAALLARSM